MDITSWLSNILVVPGLFRWVRGRLDLRTRERKVAERERAMQQQSELIELCTRYLQEPQDHVDAVLSQCYPILGEPNIRISVRWENFLPVELTLTRTEVSITCLGRRLCNDQQHTHDERLSPLSNRESSWNVSLSPGPAGDLTKRLSSTGESMWEINLQAYFIWEGSPFTKRITLREDILNESVGRYGGT
ncbi:MAG: hypothetical protein HW388_1386 [Dehalococcoidia bacterium]|nr:hypothetical protein [Dehalococcoidia bacterium]